MAIKKLGQNDLEKINGGATYEIKKIDNGDGGVPSFVAIETDPLGYYSTEEEAQEAIEKRKAKKKWHKGDFHGHGMGPGGH